ncbi:MAG: hypothetical protein J0L57_18075, partial [Burkholderiales bacterium]|nr:hypothetical protein [Burkholderiales bacterium]
SRRSTNQARTYTYPQPTISMSASTPGSILSRHGGSKLNRRRHGCAQMRSLLKALDAKAIELNERPARKAA